MKDKRISDIKQFCYTMKRDKYIMIVKNKYHVIYYIWIFINFSTRNIRKYDKSLSKQTQKSPDSKYPKKNNITKAYHKFSRIDLFVVA